MEHTIKLQDKEVNLLIELCNNALNTWDDPEACKEVEKLKSIILKYT